MITETSSHLLRGNKLGRRKQRSVCKGPDKSSSLAFFVCIFFVVSGFSVCQSFTFQCFVCRIETKAWGPTLVRRGFSSGEDGFQAFTVVESLKSYHLKHIETEIMCCSLCLWHFLVTWIKSLLILYMFFAGNVQYCLRIWEKVCREEATNSG